MADRPDGSPTAVDVISRPEWAAQEATDKDLYGSGDTVPSPTAVELILYNVPAGKTFFVTDYGVICNSVSANIVGVLYSMLIPEARGVGGGAQGMTVILNKPKRFDAGERISLLGTHLGSGSQSMEGHVGGYEI